MKKYWSSCKFPFPWKRIAIPPKMDFPITPEEHKEIKHYSTEQNIEKNSNETVFMFKNPIR